MKKRLLLVLAGVILFIFIVITSFMWFKVFYNNEEMLDSSTSASLNIRLDDDLPVMETDSIPLSAEVALTFQPYKFEVKNVGDKNQVYSILIEDSLIKGNEGYSVDSLLHRDQLEYQLFMNDKKIGHGMLSEIRNNILDIRNIQPGMENKYKLWVYVSESVQDLSWQNKYYHYEIEIKIGDN